MFHIFLTTLHPGKSKILIKQENLIAKVHMRKRKYLKKIVFNNYNKFISKEIENKLQYLRKNSIKVIIKKYIELQA
jgi:hypothetical protein